MAQTDNIGDLLITVGHYERDGVKKARNVKLGRIRKTNGRLWVVLDPYCLNPTLAADNRRATKALGFGDGQDVSCSILGENGKPLGSFGEVPSNGVDGAPDQSTTPQDDIDF